MKDADKWRACPGGLASAVRRGASALGISGDLKLYQYGRFENVAFSSWNPYMKLGLLLVFFVSYIILA